MTNEQIAKVMGWDYEEREYFWGEKFIWIGYGPSDNKVSLNNPDFNTMPLTKLLQAKMVADGWRVIIYAYITGMFEIEGLNLKLKQFKYAGCFNTEPAAIVGLFCKVYGIKEA